MIDFGVSEYEIDGDAALIREALFSYILVKPTDRTAGLDPLVPVRREGRASRRVRIWL